MNRFRTLFSILPIDSVIQDEFENGRLSNRVLPVTKFQEIQRIARKNRIEHDDQVQKLLEAASVLDGRESRTAKRKMRQIKQAVNNRAVQKSKRPFEEPSKPPNYWKELLYLGETEQGQELYWPVDDIVHLGYFAKSRGGKTTFFRDKMIQIDQLDSDVTWWSIDFNQDYRHLANRADVDVTVFPFDKLRLNPLKPPPGVSFDRWRQAFAEIFADSQALLDASENFTDAEVHELYDAYKEITDDALKELYPENKVRGSGPQKADYPTLTDLQRAINGKNFSNGSKEGRYSSTVENRVGNIVRNSFHTVDCVHGHQLEELLDRNVVFELDVLKSNVAPFWVELLFAWEQEYRVAANHDDSRVRHIWFQDELKNIHSKYKEQQIDSGEPVITERFARSRNQGMSSWGADQLPRRITEAFLGNLNVLLLGPYTDHTQFQVVAESLGITQDRHQRREAWNLEVGEAVIQLPGRPPYKLASMPIRNVDENVTDEMVVELCRDDWRRFLHDKEDPSFGSSVSVEEASDKPKTSEEPAESPVEVDVELSDAGQQLVRSIAENPTTFLTERYNDFSSNYMGNKAKKELLSNDLVEEVEVSTKQGRGKLLDFTDRGHTYLEDQGIEIELTSRGGIAHLYWQERIRERLEELGYASQLEHQDRDVYGLKNSDVAVEVAMGKNQREVEHIEDAIERGYGKIVVAGQNPEVKGYVRRKAEEEGLDEEHVVFSTVVEVANMDEITALQQ